MLLGGLSGLAVLPYAVVLVPVPEASGLRVQRAAPSVAGPSPCNGADGAWTWEQHRDGAHYYSLSGASDPHVGDLEKNFKPTLHMGPQEYFIRPYIWEWLPANDDCSFTKMNRSTFCAGMEKHNLTRFFMVGDSISYLMAESFWGLVGGSGDVGLQTSLISLERGRARLQKRIDCPAGPVSFVYVRSDRLWNSSHYEYCNEYCNPWWSKYLDDDRPTLLLANTGIHAHTMKRFEEDFDNFTSRLASVSHLRPKDLFYFRLTLPGHEKCHEYDHPFRSLQEFSLDGELARRYTWGLVPGFNDYAKMAASRLAAARKFNLTVLDPYLLTILRPDGHRFQQGDCLHYYLPGVVDWWNHLLVTMLLA